jgi:hypothetical protein
VWLFIGGGAQFEPSADARQRTSKVWCSSPTSRVKSCRQLSAADASVTLRPERGLIVPSKFYGAARPAGRPSPAIRTANARLIGPRVRRDSCAIAQRFGNAVLALSHDLARREQMGRRARATCRPPCSTSLRRCVMGGSAHELSARAPVKAMASDESL